MNSPNQLSQPTEEQKQWFWEQCGFKYYPFKSYPEEETVYKGGIVCRQSYWIYPDGNTHKEAPPIDLNNLFKYAVPLAVKAFMDRYNLSWWHGYQTLFERWHWNINDKSADPALALFWAIYKSLGGKE